MWERKDRDEEKIARLAEVFRQLGADNPESWASSEVRENIPQLARFMFLRAAWKHVVDEKDDAWMDRVILGSSARPADSCSGIGPALQRLLASGASRQDILDVIRVMQYETLSGLCSLLDEEEDSDEESVGVGWVLMETDEAGKQTGRRVVGLHETVLSMDPTGREMRPRPE